MWFSTLDHCLAKAVEPPFWSRQSLSLLRRDVMEGILSRHELEVYGDDFAYVVHLWNGKPRTSERTALPF